MLVVLLPQFENTRTGGTLGYRMDALQVGLHGAPLSQLGITDGTWIKPSLVCSLMVCQSHGSLVAFATQVTGEWHLMTMLWRDVSLQVMSVRELCQTVATLQVLSGFSHALCGWLRIWKPCDYIGDGYCGVFKSPLALSLILCSSWRWAACNCINGPCLTSK